MKQNSARRRGHGGDIRLSDNDPSDVRIIDSEMRVPLFVRGTTASSVTNDFPRRIIW
jgi:hypothetical protein